MKQTLFGHINEETALIIENYPYGSLRTQMRVWVEYRKGFGFREVRQTLNPKTGRWNKPKAGNYYELIILIKQDVNDEGKAHPGFISSFVAPYWCGVKEIKALRELDLSGVPHPNCISKETGQPFNAKRFVDMLERISRRGNSAAWVNEPEIAEDVKAAKKD